MPQKYSIHVPFDLFMNTQKKIFCMQNQALNSKIPQMLLAGETTRHTPFMLVHTYPIKSF